MPGMTDWLSPGQPGSHWVSFVPGIERPAMKKRKLPGSSLSPVLTYTNLVICTVCWAPIVWPDDGLDVFSYCNPHEVVLSTLFSVKNGHIPVTAYQ